MKSLFFGIAALLVGLPVQSQTTYLILKSLNGHMSAQTINTIPMNSMDQCEEAGAKILAIKRLDLPSNSNYTRFECIEGK